MKALAGREVWFVAGSQHMYGESAVRQVDEHAAAIAAALDGSEIVPVPVVRQAVMTTPESIRDLCLEANAARGCVGVVAWMHTFSPAKMWIGGLSVLQKPLLHLHTQ